MLQYGNVTVSLIYDGITQQNSLLVTATDSGSQQGLPHEPIGPHCQCEAHAGAWPMQLLQQYIVPVNMGKTEAAESQRTYYLLSRERAWAMKGGDNPLQLARHRVVRPY